ncbi:MAG: c-type cytochrome [Aquificaceae bacterium]
MKKVAFILTIVVGIAEFSVASEQLSREKGCMACHDINRRKVGPSYTDIAKKYVGRADAVNYLVEKIKKGSVGVWGSVPMPPQNVSDAEAKQHAEWIISLIK